MQGRDEGDSQVEMNAEDQRVPIFIEYPNNRSLCENAFPHGVKLDNRHDGLFNNRHDRPLFNDCKSR